MNIVAKRPEVFLNFEILIKEFLSRYEYSDAFFYYRNQKLFLSKIGYSFLNYPWNWNSLNKNYLEIVPFRVGEEDTSGQFFYDSNNLYPSEDLYYLPLNFLTNQVVYTSNSAQTRTANNSTAQIFAIGNEVVSYAVDSQEAFPFSSPKPVLVRMDNGVEILKRAPDGIPMKGTLFTLLPYKTGDPTCVFEQIIIFATKYIGQLGVEFQTQPPFVNPQNVVFYEINANLKYFSLTIPKNFQAGTWPIYIATYSDDSAIDCIFISSTPLIGNTQLFGFDTIEQIPYKKVPLESLEFGEFQINGGEVKKIDSSSSRCLKIDLTEGNSDYIKNYGRISKIDDDTSIFSSAITYQGGDAVSLAPSDYLSFTKSVWLNFKDFSKPFCISFSNGGSLKFKYDFSEENSGEKTNFDNNLVSLKNQALEDLKFIPYEFVSTTMGISSAFDFSAMYYQGSDTFSTDALTIAEFNELLFADLIPVLETKKIVYQNDPMANIVRNFKGTFDTYPLIRTDIVAENMIELNIKNLNEFKETNGIYTHPTEFQILSYDNKRYKKISLYVFNALGWDNTHAYSFYSSSAKIFYNKPQWLFQVNKQNVTTIRYGEFVESGSFRIFLSTSDTIRNFDVKFYLILE